MRLLCSVFELASGDLFSLARRNWRQGAPAGVVPRVMHDVGQVCVHTYTYNYTYTCDYEYTCTYIYIYVPRMMHDVGQVCVYIHIHIHIHIHTRVMHDVGQVCVHIHA